MAALDGVRVLDLSQFESGPGCAQQLAWLGADVVKIEPTNGGDGFRARGTPDRDAMAYIMQNSNKRSVVIDLRKPEGRDLVLRLVPRFDVVVENYAFGVAQRLGVDYETLRKVHPGLVYGSVKGFGMTGPYRDYRALDPIGQASGGGMSVTGEPGGRPLKAGFTLGDSAAGLYLCIGILAAYIERQRTGQGQLVDISMQECNFNLLRTGIGTFEGNYEAPPMPRKGNRITSPTDCYPCAPGGPDDYVQVAVWTPDMWAALTETIGKAGLQSDPRFDTIQGRQENGDALWEEVAEWTRGRTKHEAMVAFQAAGVPAAAVLNIPDLFRDPHMAERGAIVTVEHPQRGPLRLPAPAVRLSAPQAPVMAAPLLGADTRAVLASELGLAAEELDRLERAGVIRGRA